MQGADTPELHILGYPAYDFAFLITHLFLKTYMVPSFQSFLEVMIKATLNAYLPYISWEKHEEFLIRVKIYWLMLLLARVDGKSPVEYLNAAQKEAVRYFVFSQLSIGKNSITLSHEHKEMHNLWLKVPNSIFTFS